MSVISVAAGVRPWTSDVQVSRGGEVVVECPTCHLDHFKVKANLRRGPDVGFRRGG